MTTHTVADVRYQCPRGHFVAEGDVHAEDYLDPGAYYGVSTAWEYWCRACMYTYADRPRIVRVREYQIEVES